MDKHQLIGLTLDQLLDNFRSSPESFEYEDKDYTPHKVTTNPTIFWQPKFELKDNSVVPDPNNKERTVIITYMDFESELRCYIYQKSVISLSQLNGTAADATMVSKQSFMTLRSNYRKFIKLKKLIMARDRRRKNDEFLRKLCSIFPSALDRHLLG